MTPSTEQLSSNVQILRSRVNRYGIYGLLISLATILLASAMVSLQMTGAVTLDGMFTAHRENFPLRLLDLLPFVLTIWGQHIGTIMAFHASAMIMEQTDDLRAETTAWKKKSHHDVTHDPLTSLPNRVKFYDIVQSTIRDCATGRGCAILFADVDGFREINEAFGPQCGDTVLRHMATRLSGLVAASDRVARMGGDEFAILLVDIPSPEIPVAVARRIHKALQTPFEVDRSRIEISVSIGIALYPVHGAVADVLVQRAEAAMALAKGTHDGYIVHSEDLALDDPRRLMLLTELRHAIERDTLDLHFQPKVNLASGRVTSAEALVRWNHPQHGRIPPQEFVPLAERTRLIRPLTRWVLNRSLAQLARWREAGVPLGLSVNVSTRDLVDPGFVPDLLAAIAVHGVNPVQLTLEITESSLMSDAEKSLDVLAQLHGLNLRLSIDDFGTGYSSLAYLSRLPVNEIKIDKAFVMGMMANPADRLIVDATIGLGHNLHLEVVAEGVESEEVLVELARQGCDLAQGYHISAPLDGPAFDHWLAQSRWRPA